MSGDRLAQAAARMRAVWDVKRHFEHIDDDLMFDLARSAQDGLVDLKTAPIELLWAELVRRGVSGETPDGWPEVRLAMLDREDVAR